MKAYLGNHELKAQLIEQITAHRAADHLVRGRYRDKRNGHFFGCAVGCSIESLNRLTGSSYQHDDHSCYEQGFGVPIILARLQDSLFESLPVDEHLDWPLAFWDAVPVGADLTMVWPQFAHWLLTDPVDGVIRFAETEQATGNIERVADLYARWIGGAKPTANEWATANIATNAAANAAAYAADAAANAYAAVAAAANAANAANAAVAAANAYAAVAYFRRKQAAKLLELISSSK